MSVMKEYNILHHYETTHKVKYGSVIGEARKHLISELKSKMQRHRSTFFKATHVQKVMCAGILRIKKLRNVNIFSVALDESTDITNICQLLIFVKTVDEQFSIKEELLDLVLLPTSAKGSDIYSVLVSVVEKYRGFSKCSCIATDGAKCMTINLLKLCDVMKDVTRGGNKAQSHRKLVEFLKELSVEFHDITLHSEIRWLSAGKTLTAFFAGKIEYDYLGKLQNKECLCTLPFLTDITEHLNILNLTLQSKELNICQLMSQIKNEFNSADFKLHRQYVIELREEFEKQFSY
ncbi:hypothetical protein PR048_018267 [Dryococelus australis]|uniref:DUF4371 domain-containing protein n=1 Tax=Dryococelus australis TaxID=614101 RepID=A0ABQ9HC66_9NEOP|nr:hypothetical protein PR048_018267 [Dryococelus australis]